MRVLVITDKSREIKEIREAAEKTWSPVQCDVLADADQIIGVFREIKPARGEKAVIIVSMPNIEQSLNIVRNLVEMTIGNLTSDVAVVLTGRTTILVEANDEDEVEAVKALRRSSKDYDLFILKPATSSRLRDSNGLKEIVELVSRSWREGTGSGAGHIRGYTREHDVR